MISLMTSKERNLSRLWDSSDKNLRNVGKNFVYSACKFVFGASIRGAYMYSAAMQIVDAAEWLYRVCFQRVLTQFLSKG